MTIKTSWQAALTLAEPTLRRAGCYRGKPGLLRYALYKETQWYSMSGIFRYFHILQYQIIAQKSIPELAFLPLLPSETSPLLLWGVASLPMGYSGYSPRMYPPVGRFCSILLLVSALQGRNAADRSRVSHLSQGLCISFKLFHLDCLVLPLFSASWAGRAALLSKCGDRRWPS